MGQLSEITELSVIRTAWKHVFRSNDPFSWPFRSKVASGLIFYPTSGYHLTDQQFRAVLFALKQTGEDGFFISTVESEGLSFLDREWGHWACDNPSYEDYLKLPLTLENAIYSKNGRWGVLISHEMHALVGGSSDFISALSDRYRSYPDDLRLLRDAWAGNPNAGWLEPTISRCVGSLGSSDS